MRQKPVARYATLIFTLLLSSAVILVGISMLREGFIDLNEALKNTGRISSRQIGKYFSFTLVSSPINFNVYRASRSYDDLQSILAIGDSVTVYSVNSATANLQVAQIEKNGKIVVDKQLLQGQNRIGGIIALLGGPILAGIAIRQFRRNKILR